jgi:hypothetical protein
LDALSIHCQQSTPSLFPSYPYAMVDSKSIKDPESQGYGKDEPLSAAAKNRAIITHNESLVDQTLG